MKTFLTILKDLARIFLSIFAPFILIILGGLLIGWSISNDYTILVWTGVVMVGAGILWGLILLLYYGPMDWS